ncbi:MAG: ribbon-helix-helix domain-containing protein [Acidobacteriota bacterium]|nr:ribbon-helix-helix domain-containing protein [Acidobacteriota bacterium]
MRTTVRLNDQLLSDAKKLAVESGRSLTAVIEDALRETVLRKKTPGTQQVRIKLPVHRGSGLRPGVDLDNSAALLDVMEER